MSDVWMAALCLRLFTLSSANNWYPRGCPASSTSYDCVNVLGGYAIARQNEKFDYADGQRMGIQDVRMKSEVLETIPLCDLLGQLGSPVSERCPFIREPPQPVMAQHTYKGKRVCSAGALSPYENPQTRESAGDIHISVV